MEGIWEFKRTPIPEGEDLMTSMFPGPDAFSWAGLVGQDPECAVFLFVELDLSSGAEDNVFERTLTQVLNGFEGLTYDSDKKNVTLPEIHGSAMIGMVEVDVNESAIALSSPVFKDILRNFARGKGSLLELLQYGLASKCREYLSLYLSNSISFEMLTLQVSEAFNTQGLLDQERSRFNIEEYEGDDSSLRIEASFDFEGPRWSANVIVRKYWHRWDQSKFNFRIIIDGLSESNWKSEILTEDCIQILKEFE